jgi:hypothetical protein
MGRRHGDAGGDPRGVRPSSIAFGDGLANLTPHGRRELYSELISQAFETECRGDPTYTP